MARVEGRAEVRLVVRSALGIVYACVVLDGTLRRGAFVRVLRDHVPVWRGPLAELRRFSSAVEQVPAPGAAAVNGLGQPAEHDGACGVVLPGFATGREGDVLEAYQGGAP